MQMFVQTDRFIVDVSKIAWIQMPRSAARLIVVHFAGGEQLKIEGLDAEQLFEGMRTLARKNVIAVSVQAATKRQS